MQVLSALVQALINNPGVRAALGGLVSAVLLGVVAWAQSPEGAALLGAGWLIQLLSPSIAELAKSKALPPPEVK